MEEKTIKDNKMICAIDVETYTRKGGNYYPTLDCTKFTIGCIITERNRKKPEYYENKEEMWNRIIQLGKTENKRNKTLNIYAHNMAYDFYAIANLKDKNLKWYSNKPFIVAYNHPTKKDKNNKPIEIIKFLDTHAIFKMPLKKIGEKIGKSKLEMPEKITKKEQLKEYVKTDTEICIESILWLKELLKETKTPIRRIYTINQIAISYMLKEIKKDKNKKEFFWNEHRNETRRTLRPEEIHSAYRGGKVEAYKTGIIKKVTYIDCNSLYPHIARTMKFPKLETERKHEKPTKGEAKELRKKIGISRCLIENENNEYGLIPIRTTTSSYYPKKKKMMIGTWTNKEITEAEKEGYKVIDTEWIITYDTTKNILKEPINKIYEQRKKSKTELEKYLWKMIMNASFAKLAQTRTGQEIKIDTIEEAQKYLKKNYKMIKGIKGTYDIIYKKENKETKKKPYYTPIIPTLINAEARIYMYKEMKKIPIKKLVYTDTDSIIFEGDYLCEFKISKEMGDFKVEAYKEEIEIYGKKTYMIGNEIKVAGIRKSEANKENFKKGIMKNKKMNTIYTCKDINQIGKFKNEERNLKEQLKEHTNHIKEMEKTRLYIDYDITNINYFLKNNKFK